MTSSEVELDLSRIKATLAELVAFDTQNPPGRELEAPQGPGKRRPKAS